MTNQKRDVHRDGISPEKPLRDIWYVHDGCFEPKSSENTFSEDFGQNPQPLKGLFSLNSKAVVQSKKGQILVD